MVYNGANKINEEERDKMVHTVIPETEVENRANQTAIVERNVTKAYRPIAYRLIELSISLSCGAHLIIEEGVKYDSFTKTSYV